MSSPMTNLKLANQEQAPSFLNLLSLPHVERTFWRGMAIYSLEDPAAHVYVVLKGRVKIMRSSPEGAQKILSIRYGGDTRRARFGYLLPQTLDPTRTVQGGDRYMLAHADLLGEPRPGAAFPGTAFPIWDAKSLWPNARSIKDEDTLAWAAMTSRYFAVAVHPAQVRLIDRDPSPPSPVRSGRASPDTRACALRA